MAINRLGCGTRKLSKVDNATRYHISNSAIRNDTVVRDVVVQGRLVTNNFTFESGSTQVRISESDRAEALNNVNAPLDELFDFVPRGDSKWIYKPNQWNDTWKGKFLICEA